MFQTVGKDNKFFSMQQHLDEIGDLCEFIKEKKCENFIEIGTYDGGTFYTLANICTGIKISIDNSGGHYGVGEERKNQRNKDLSSIFSGTTFIEGDSHCTSVQEELTMLLGSNKVDLLFIDGDHTYEGAKKDYEFYRKFVKEDGYIVFHDIIDTELHRNHKCRVDLLWNELIGEKHEFLTQNGEWGGIGVLKKTDLPLINLAVWQIYYDAISKLNLDKDFIAYDNTNKVTLFFESEVIIDIHNTQKEIWNKSDYVGVFSWRFKEKTNITYPMIVNRIYNSKNKVDVYNFTPSIYDEFHSAYSICGFKPVLAICTIIDKYELFPFKTYGHDSLDRFRNFCHYFICKPEIFDDFVANYLIKLFVWLQTCNDPYLLMELRTMVNHRGQLYPIHPFLMEGLFECYVIYKGYTHESILFEEIKANQVGGPLVKKALNSI